VNFKAAYLPGKATHYAEEGKGPACGARPAYVDKTSDPSAMSCWACYRTKAYRGAVKAPDGSAGPNDAAGSEES